MVSYTGNIQTSTLEPGRYRIECWGGKGGNGSNSNGASIRTGGTGGYSVAEVTFNTYTTIYMGVGGRGNNGLITFPTTAAGGWNGGGDATNNSDSDTGGAGGGCSHVALVTGQLRDIGVANISKVLIVAGGGGGAPYGANGTGHGGGLVGGGPSQISATGGGTQSAAGALGGFGYAGPSGAQTDGRGGGGGLYGGSSGSNSAGGAGGSGYINPASTTSGFTARMDDPNFKINPDSTGNGFINIITLELFITNDDGEYDIYFGPYETFGTPSYKQWKLRHCDISIDVGGKDSAMGIPNYPARACNIFDMSGPTRTFELKGLRVDGEEYFSNYDWIHTQFNVQTINQNTKSQRFETFIGMEWLLSSLQVALTGFVLKIVPKSPYGMNSDGTIKGDARFLQGQFNVGITGIQMTIGEGYNTINYSIKLVERSNYGRTGSKLKVYDPWPRNVSQFDNWSPTSTTVV